jgi:hypothetical protein
MKPRAVLILALTLAPLAAPLAAEAQQAGEITGKSPTPVGAEGIKRLLTSHDRWTLYWDRSGTSRPRFGSKTMNRSWSATLEFMRVGPRLVGHAERVEIAPGTECETDVRVRETGFTIVPCWPGEDVPLTYDPMDSEYPFKGRNGGTLFWLAPLR